jgi:asparagine synthetase B (glutamine-hydrolysing)
VSFYELSVYMHDQLLRDTDCMSMAHALEVRVPLIGRDVVEAVAALSVRALDGQRPKQLLRDIASRHLPAESLQLPKHGFTLDWVDILSRRPDTADPTAHALLRAGRYQRERALLLDSRRSFARFFALEVLTRKTEQPLTPILPETIDGGVVGVALGT